MSLSLFVGPFLVVFFPVFSEDVIFELNLLRLRPYEASTLHGSLLLPLFSLFVFLFILWSRLSFVVSVIYLFCKLNPELTLLNPRRFWLQSNSALLQLEILKHQILVHTRNHVWWLNEWEAKGRLQVDGGKAPLALEWDFDVLEESAQSLLLGEHVKEHVLFLIDECLRVFSVVFKCSFEIHFGSLFVAQDVINDGSYQPKLIRVLLCDCVKYVVQFD